MKVKEETSRAGMVSSRIFSAGRGKIRVVQKKALASMLTGILIIMSVLPAIAETVSSISTSTAFEKNTGLEALSGDFDVTYTGHFVGGDFGVAPIVELRDANNRCIDMRFDNWGWTDRKGVV